MSKLYYKINLEEFFDSDDDYREYHNHLPHFKQLKDWLPKEWAECHIEQTKEASAFFASYQNEAMCNDKPLPVFHCNDDPDDPDTNLLYWVTGYNFSDYWFISEIQIEK